MKKQELREIICETLGLDKIPNIIETQIHRLTMELGLTYKEVARAVVYYYGVKKNEYQPMYGIGIIQNVYPEANRYYEKLKKQREEQLRSVEEAKKHSNIILEVKQIPKRRSKKIIDIEKLKVDD